MNNLDAKFEYMNKYSGMILRFHILIFEYMYIHYDLKKTL